MDTQREKRSAIKLSRQVTANPFNCLRARMTRIMATKIEKALSAENRIEVMMMNVKTMCSTTRKKNVKTLHWRTMAPFLHNNCQRDPEMLQMKMLRKYKKKPNIRMTMVPVSMTSASKAKVTRIPTPADGLWSG